MYLGSGSCCQGLVTSLLVHAVRIVAEKMVGHQIQEYTERRDFVCDMLSELGFEDCFIPQGSFFAFAKLPRSCNLTDVSASVKTMAAS